MRRGNSLHLAQRWMVQMKELPDQEKEVQG